jgi:RNA recognition motif-containing protein
MPVEEWKNDGSIVAVINLNGGACAHELFEIFSQWGEVQQVELEMRSEEDAVRGIALIKFRQVESAEEVAKKMQGFEYNNAPLEIHPATVLVVGRDVFEVKDEEWVEAQGCSEE